MIDTADTAAWLIRQAQQFEDQHAPQHLPIGLREAVAEIERLRAALRDIATPPEHYTINDCRCVAAAALAQEKPHDR